MTRPHAWPLRRPVAEAMEERVLHSADLSPLALLPAAGGESPQQHESLIVDAAATERQTREIVFVDGDLSGIEQLLLDLQTQRGAGRPIEIVLIGAEQDGIALISQTLAGRGDIGAVHLLAHGSDGVLQLGKTRLDESSLLSRAAEIGGWGDALTADADLLLYGCDVAQTALGEAFVRDLALLTGADVAASADLTGAAALGGNWTLELQTGAIETAGIADGWIASNWYGVLATYIADPTKADGAVGSLRWAVIQANANPGTDTIQLLAGTHTLTLAGAGEDLGAIGDLDVTSDIVITGASANPADTVIRTTVADRIFDLVTGSLTLSDVTVSGGAGNQSGGALATANFTSATLRNVVLSGNSGSNGGAIYAFGSLTLDRVRITGNTSSGTGGGLTVRTTANLSDVEISGNSAATNGGGIYVQSALASVTLNRVTISGNQAATGGGVYAINGSLAATNVTLSGNTASGAGGGIFFNNGSYSLTDSTVANNSGASGGGIGGPIKATLKNTVVASNTGGNAAATQTTAGWNIDTDGSAVVHAGTDRIVSAAALKLVALADNGGFTKTHALLAGSVAIDTGNPAAASTDQRGQARIGTPDVGAYEYTANTAPVLDASRSPALQSVLEDAAAPSGAVGTLVSELVDFAVPSGQLDNVTDPDLGALRGIAVRAADTSRGSWWYSIDNGASWNSLGTVGVTNARLLAADASTRIHFRPNADFNGTLPAAITFHAWDRTDGVNGALSDQTRVDTALDTFATASYSNNAGTIAWSGSWVESDAGGGGAGGGNIAISGGQLLVNSGVADSIWRSIDLSQALAATLRFDFVTSTANGSGSLEVQVSGNGGASYTTLIELRKNTPATSGSVELDISAYLGSDTRVRFLVDPEGKVVIVALDNVRIDATLMDTGGSTEFSTASDTASLVVVPVDDAPQGADRTVSATEDTAYVFQRADFAFADAVDAASASGANALHSVRVATLPATGTLRNDGTAVVVGQFIAVADIDAGKFSFTPAADANGAGAASFRFQVRDDGGTANGGIDLDPTPRTMTVDVAAVNDAPMIGAPVAQAGLINAPVVFSSAGGNAISVADVDAASGTLQVALAATNGTATLAGTTGLTFTVGNGSGNVAMTFRGTLGAINAALNGLRFDPASGFTGSTTLQIDVDDQGNAGSGGAKTAQAIVQLDIAATNSAPVLVGAENLLAIAEDATGNAGTLVSALIAGHVTDANAGAMTGIAVTGVDNSNGQWQYSLDGGSLWTAFGTPSSSSARLLGADALTRVRFVPASDWNGTVSNGIAFRAWDRTSGSAGSLVNTTTASLTVRDNFGNVSYSNNDGSVTWASNWVDSDGNPTAGQISIGSGRLNFAGGLLSSSAIHRQVDLSGSSGATLSFDYNDLLGLSTVTLEVSGNGGASWTTLASSWSNGSNSASFDLSSFAASNTRIRLSISGLVGGGSYWVDNLQVAFTRPANGGSTAFSSATAASSIAVLATNDPPSGTSATITAPKNGGRPLARGDFGFADAPGEGNGFASVLLQLPSAGTLKLSGTTLTGPVEVSVAQLDAGALVYAPVPGAAGNGHATIGFQVRDDGGTANGGIDLDPVQRTLTVDVINTAPVITSNGGGASAALAVPENSTAVTTVTATDADGDAILYNIAGGADAARFSINGTTGELRFVSAPNFEVPTDVGADNVYHVTVRAADPTGGAVTQAIAVTVTDVLGAPGAVTGTLVFSTASSQSPAAGGKTWNNTDLLQYGDLGDRFDLDGGLTTGTVDQLAGFVAPAPVRGMHYVQNAITIGSGLGVKFNLSPGDLLLVFDPGAAPATLSLNLGALVVDRKDIVVFRPDAAGNYSSGTYSMLLNDGVKNGATSYNVHGLTLVETDTTVGGVLLSAGTFIVAHSTPALQNSVFTFTASSTGTLTTTTSNTALLIDGNQIGLAPSGDTISGLHLLTAATAFNDAALPAGTLLMAVDGGSHVIGGVAQDAVDIVALTVTRTEQNGGTIATGALLFDGSDLGMTAALNGFTVIAGNVTNSAPTVANPIASHSTDEDSPYSFTFAANTFADSDAGDVLTYSASLVNGAALPGWLSFNAATRRFSGLPTNGDVGNLLLRVTATDTSGAKATSDFALTINNVNDAPVLDGSENLPTISEDPASNPGASVTSLLPGHVTDVDAGALAGIAVIAVDNANGAWQYSTNGGSSWNPFGSVTASTARLLASDAATRVRFVPNTHWNGSATIQFRAWDQTSGSAGGTANITATGGTSAFSVATATAGIVVPPVNDAPTGLPLISGSAVEDQLLTADVSGIADGDGLGAFSVQWLRDGSAIAGATASTLLLGDADVGKAISVRVSYTDGGGTLETLTSAATALVANVNDAPTGLPVISGSAAEYQTLSADVSGIADNDGLGSFSYQWQRNGSDIAGATGSTLLLGSADIGKTIGLRVSYVDGHGTLETLDSAVVGPVANVNDAPSGRPVISGSAVEGQTLSAGASGIADADGLGAFGVQWLRNGSAIAGATGTTLLLGNADVGTLISVRVSYVDGHGTPEIVTSAATGPVINVNDPATGLPVITGSAIEDRLLTADVSGIADGDGLGAFSFQWLRNGGAIAGATATTLLLGDADVGQTISVRVSYLDGNGTLETLTSAAIGPVQNINDTPRGSDATLTVNRNASRTLSVADFGFADTAGESDAFKSVLLQLPSAGMLRLGGTVLAAATEVTRAQLDAGDVVYAPAFGGSGNAYATLKFQVRDDGGTINGGVDLDPVQRALSFDVLNEAPVITSDGGGATAALAIQENRSTLTTVRASDADLDTLVYSIGGGADAARFRIDASTGILSFVVPPNVEVPTDAGADNVYNVTVRVSDGVAAATQALAVSVLDVQEAIQNTFEQRVNSSLSNDQRTSADNRGSHRAVAIAPNGNYVVVWSSKDQDGSGWGVYGQRFDLSGAALGGEFRINQTTSGDQRWASVVNDLDGNFVVAWTTQTSGSDCDVMIRRYAADGSALGGELRVNTTTAGNQENASIAIDANGNVVVVWQGNGPGDSDGIFGRRFAADGSAIDGTEFRINTDLIRSQADASVAMNGSGAFAVTWDNSSGVQLRLYSAGGAPLTGQIGVASGSESRDGVVALADDGTAIVVWRDVVVDKGIYLQRFDSAGATIGSTTVVNTTTSGDQSDPSIAIDGSGNHIVVWEGRGPGDDHGIFGQRFDATGARVGSEFRINQATKDEQDRVSVAMLDLDNFVAVWTSDVNGALDDEVLLRQYGSLNTAPKLSGINDLPTIAEDPVSNPGMRVSDLIAGTISDPDPAALSGIAVIGVDDANGSWQFSTNGGMSWAAFGAVSDSSARLLASDPSTRVRFVPNADWNGSVNAGLTVRAWDRTSGSAGGTADVRANGGQTAFGSATASSRITVTPVNDLPTGQPLVSGSVVEDQVLSAVTIGLADADGLAPFSYQWLRNGAAIGGATASTLLLGDADVGKQISVRVGWLDGGGTQEALTSAQTGSVVNVNDAPTGAPLIVGSAVEDAMLSVVTGGIADDDGLGAFSYQWSRNGVEISGATGSSLLLGDADVGKQISVRVSWIDGHGTAEALTSAQTAPVSNVNDVPTGAPAIDGSAAEGQTLTADVTAIGDADGLGIFNYQWLRDGVAIAGATGGSLLLGDADVGKRISVQVGWTDGHGTAEMLASAPTAPVANVNDPPVGLPLIVGSVTEDQTLSVDTRGISDDDGLGPFSVQWLRNDAAIAGATGSSLLLGDADVGARISVRISYLDGHGTAETLTSAATAPVANVNDVPRLDRSIADLRAIVGTAFGKTLPADSFSDVDPGDELVWSLTTAGGDPLPAWLVFDPATRTLSGTPARTDLGSMTLRVTATDLAGASASDVFRFDVVLTNVAPQVADPIGNQSMLEGTTWNWQVPAAAFTDTDVGDELTLAAALSSGAALPGWLSFDPATQRFTGTPANADVGALQIRLTARDLTGAEVSTDFRLDVLNINDAPTALRAIVDQRVEQDSPFALMVDADSFADPDVGDSLRFSAALASGAVLPGWLVFDAASRSFSGTPANADVGELTIRVTATDDAGEAAFIDFSLTVDNINDAPGRAGALPDQLATENQPFVFAIPAGTFIDIDAGDLLSLHATLASGAALPAWLVFDPSTPRLAGTPANADVGSIVIRVTATDRAGARASGEFRLDVRNVNDAPLLSGVDNLASVLEDSRHHEGTLVAELIAGHFSDVDTGSGRGIAVTALDSRYGNWQYTLDGKGWTDFGAVSEQSARLLAANATTAIRFVPNERWFGHVADGLTLRAWDQSSGSAGQTADVRDSGGSSAFGAERVIAGITVVHVNHAPEARLALADRAAIEAVPTSFTLPPATFVDSDDGDVLVYRATLADGSPLPAWLVFDPATLTFKGSPQHADIGSMTIRVIATDGSGASAQAGFVLTVAHALPAGGPVAAIAEVPAAQDPPAEAVEAEKVAAAVVVFAEAANDRIAAPANDELLAGVAPASLVAGNGIVVNLPVSAEGARHASRSDAMLATLPVAQFSTLTVSAATNLLGNQELLRKFDDLKHQMDDIAEQQRQMIASSLAISSGLSLGYVVWLVRGGVLLSSMLSALPAWQMIDPMPVLAAAGAAKTKGGKRWFGGRDIDTDDRDVEKLFDARTAESTATAAAPSTSARASAPIHPTEIRS